jgi:hypothetical protein
MKFKSGQSFKYKDRYFEVLELNTNEGAYICLDDQEVVVTFLVTDESEMELVED